MSDCYGTEDVFEMIEDNNDDFTLQEIIPGPGVAPGGYTGMVLKKKSDANYDTEWDYQGSGGILLTGQCETYNDLPADPAQGEAWAVGEEAPYECYAWFGEWIDLGEIFPSGVSPEVTITEITGGTRLTITDAQHPDGQSADIMNGVDGQDGQDGAQGPEGPAGPGVPTGGSAGQFLKKSSSTNYDTEWDTLGADDVGYDGSQSYTAGTAGKQIKDLGTELTLAEDSVTPYVVGNTNTTGSTLNPGTFVWVKNHSTLSDGLYTVKTTAIVSGGSVVDTNMEHVDAGGLNTLRNSIDEVSAAIPEFPIVWMERVNPQVSDGTTFKKRGQIVLEKGKYVLTLSPSWASGKPNSYGLSNQSGSFEEAATYKSQPTTNTYVLLLNSKTTFYVFASIASDNGITDVNIAVIQFSD